MSAKHTPGPWRILPEEMDRPYVRVRGTWLGERYKVANVLTVVYDGVHEREAQETRANARLIAAAPELLEAGKRVTDAFRALGNAGNVITEFKARKECEAAMLALDAAIAKATGETP